jgi:hypothetical protein
VKPASIRNETKDIFNRVWIEEYSDANPKSTISRISWTDLATCYAEMSGEQLLLDPNIYPVKDAVSDVKSNLVSKIVLRVKLDTERLSNLSINFDNQGFVKRAKRKDSPEIISIHSALGSEGK